MQKWNKKIFLVLAVLLLNGLFFYSAKAATENKNINVQLVVPGGGGGGGGSSLPPNNPPPVIPIVSSTTTNTTTSNNPVISSVLVTPGVKSAIITFNTDKNSTAQINYGETLSLGGSATDGLTLVINHTVLLLGLLPNKIYYYQIIATDVSLNSTSTSILNFKTLVDTIPPPDVSNLQILAGQNSITLNWQNPSLSFTPDFVGVKILKKIGSPASGPNDAGATVIYNGSGSTVIDNSVLNGFTYFYTVYSYDASGNFSSGNFVQGKISGVVPPPPIIPTSTPPSPLPPVIQPAVPPSITPPIAPYAPPSATVPGFEKLTLDKVKFLSGSHQIELTANGKIVLGLAGSNLSVGIKKSFLLSEPKSLILHVGNIDQHQFSFDSSNNTYYADISFPQSGNSQAYIEINYGSDQFDSLGFGLQAVDLGQVTDSKNNGLSGVEVTLYKENGEFFPAQIFGQKNSQITGSDALIGWMVPNGRYYLTANKDKFYQYSGQIFTVSNNIIANPISLFAVPLKIQDVIDPNASLTKNSVNLVKNIAEKSSVFTALAVSQVENAVGIAKEMAADPAVKQIANKVVAPTAVGIAAAATSVLVSWADILPLLRFLFLQPLLIFGRGKREKWGTVYNSLSKMPIDLALVRLFNLDTGKLVQTKVTSSDGRYFFVVDVGRYRLEVRKGAFVFPTVFLKGFQTDGRRLDIYHGEEIQVSDKGAVITANIPLDPADKKLKTPFSLMFGKTMRRMQTAVSWIGLLVTLGSLYISPTWYMWVLLGVHLSMMLAFRRLSRPPVAKGWGIVYDEKTKKPLSRVVARLFDSKFNKLVATEITGADGKYYFMAGDNQYYVSYDLNGYESLKTEIIDLKDKDTETIAKDVKLKKK